MSARRDPAVLLERIRDLEVELASCRSELAFHSDPSEAAGLAFLEVTPTDRRYLVPVNGIREVVPMAEPAPLAGAPAWILGTVPYGSHTVPLIDLGHRLGEPPSELSPGLQVVVLDAPAWVGLVVRTVGRVIDLAAGDLRSPPPDVPSARFLVAAHRGSDGDTLLVLSPSRLASAVDA